jgi:hypothetical protein
MVILTRSSIKIESKCQLIDSRWLIHTPLSLLNRKLSPPIICGLNPKLHFSFEWLSRRDYHATNFVGRLIKWQEYYRIDLDITHLLGVATRYI